MQTWAIVFYLLFRIGEIIGSAIVVGILGRFQHFVDAAPHGHNDSRIIYSLVIASLSLAASLIMVFPWIRFFYAFILDFIFFILWIVAFGLMANLTVSGGCHSTWYVTDWGYYWGRWWTVYPTGNVTTTVVGTHNCGDWRANLAFTFITALLYFCSAVLGIAVVAFHRSERRDQIERNEKRGVTADGLEQGPQQTPQSAPQPVPHAAPQPVPQAQV
ncbi:hypothetical protein ASPZODRAFT_14861 [Penicilliopsis zonata CBS 506.65]|uniref:MARVEL domain-containing protein n=1 Tax=Penicilliopsis zonata CBS 506.65 TaxID=1073090 RepID=A0A1L9SNN4_9EURO|nr:hypothetical protein ASPZODRAFT_14861 [Penicilliopsis zonata CBS 506.65]OJJ48736.1 hypothetical protein ASPZODRAFT_14861 [Penicilliopsis zonata CBS 506.65]